MRNEQRQAMREAGKPLGVKNYGSIPHLHGSRVGPGDHYCNEGHARIALNPRRGDTVFVTEKLDGSNVGVARVGGELVALTRGGYRAELSEHETHRLFAAWLRVNEWRFDCIDESCRVAGEWLAHAVGTRYGFPLPVEGAPFAVFDYFDKDNRRVTHLNMMSLAAMMRLAMPPLLRAGHNDAVTVDEINEGLGKRGKYSADHCEGFVVRVETNGKFNFMVKYVREGKEDGKYLDGPIVWNVDREKFLARLEGS